MVSEAAAPKSGGPVGHFQCSRFPRCCQLSLSRGLQEGILEAVDPAEQQQAAAGGLGGHQSAAGRSLGSNDHHI